MSGVLMAALQLPDSCRIHKRVFKKLFIENARLSAQDRRAFTSDVEEVIWEYTLKPSTIAIMPHSDDEREYDEIAVIDTSLKALKNAGRIAEVIHRGIPYPLILILRYETRESLSLAPKRFSRAEKGAIVAEEFASTGWLNAASMSDIERRFAESVALSNLPQSNYFSLYAALVDRVHALQISRRTGEYHVMGDLDRRLRQQSLLAEADELEAQVNDCRVAMKKEHQFNHRVELNTKLKQLEGRLLDVVNELRTSRNGA